MNMTPNSVLIAINVCAALRLRGSLKAVMPLEIASTPVSAVQPLANALSSRKIVNGCASSAKVSRLFTTPSCPVLCCQKPTISIASMLTTKK